MIEISVSKQIVEASIGFSLEDEEVGCGGRDADEPADAQGPELPGHGWGSSDFSFALDVNDPFQERNDHILYILYRIIYERSAI